MDTYDNSISTRLIYIEHTCTIYLEILFKKKQNMQIFYLIFAVGVTYSAKVTTRPLQRMLTVLSPEWYDFLGLGITPFIKCNVGAFPYQFVISRTYYGNNF